MSLLLQRLLYPLACTVIIMTLPTVSVGQQLTEKFLDGELRLSYSFFGQGASGATKAKLLYDAKKWQELAIYVADQGSVLDIYYFYLGKAAEGLNRPKAAEAYYRLALESVRSDGCASVAIYNPCQGIDVTKEARVALADLTALEPQAWVFYSWVDAPKVSDVLRHAPIRVTDLVKAPTVEPTKGRFETDDEFAARSANRSGTVVGFRLNTSSDSNCKTKYSHSEGTYYFSRCVAVTPNSPVDTVIETVEPIRLSNAYDSRLVTRKIITRYIFKIRLAVDGKLAISRDLAEQLDADLMVGLVIDGHKLESSCLPCEERKEDDKREKNIKELNSLTESVSALNNKRSSAQIAFSGGWKERAFRDGEITDEWSINIAPEKIRSAYIYSPKFNKIIAKLTY